MKDWVWNIFIMTTSLAFVELVLPEGGMQKFLKFIFSLFILAVIIYPFGDKALEGISATLSVNPEKEVKLEEDSDAILERLMSIQTRQIEDVYREKSGKIEQDTSSFKNPGISLPPADIYSNDEEELN